MFRKEFQEIRQVLRRRRCLGITIEHKKVKRAHRGSGSQNRYYRRIQRGGRLQFSTQSSASCFQSSLRFAQGHYRHERHDRQQ